LIVFASDNGTALRPDEDAYLHTGGNLHGRKSEAYEGGIKTPMIACWKGKIKAGSTSNVLSAFWDFLPTAADIANVKAPEDIDGISILPTLLGKDKLQKQHEYLYWERSQVQAIHKGDMKAVIKNAKDQVPTIEIFNLAKDPTEKTNLAETMPELKAEFLNLAKTARVESKIFPLIKGEKKPKKKTTVE
jgi:arylsulfatase A